MSWIDDEGRIHRDNSPSQVSSPPPPRQIFSIPLRKTVYCSERSYIIAGILAIEFGYLGVHNFYMKYYKKGIIQLSVSLGITLLVNYLQWFSLIIITGMWLWGIIEGILILSGKIYTDGEGYGFWHNWLQYEETADFIKPRSYPHMKAWIITAVITLIYLTTIVLPLILEFVNVIK